MVIAVATDRSFGRYRVTGTLGAGAMGEVYCAVDEVLGREVAVKTLRGNASGLAARILDERFRLEARAIAALHHPGVVQVFDIDLSADPPYLVMERVTGPALKDRLAAGPLDEYALRALGIQIGRALAAAHAAGIVHRDVKPANILAAGADTWKLADFGVAHVPESSLTMTGQFVGSPAYAPPEALVRGQSGPAGDVYGLGATLYQAAAGRWPRLEETSGALLAPMPPLLTLVPALLPELAAVIDRAVAIEPEQRPSAGELADAIARAGTDAGVGHAPRVAVAAVPGPGPAAYAGAGATSIPGVGAMSVSGAAAVALPAVAGGAVRWKPWAIGGAVVLAIGLLAVATRGSSRAVLPGTPGAAMIGDPSAGRPGEIRANPPPGMDGKQTKEWNKIFEELERGHFEGARHKLDEFEDRYGATDETRELRPQLDALGPDVHGRPEGRGRGKKHHGDD
jgi:tRNA A-37 threonylcarbamoyl transferase component Bud32